MRSQAEKLLDKKKSLPIADADDANETYARTPLVWCWFFGWFRRRRKFLEEKEKRQKHVFCLVGLDQIWSLFLIGQQHRKH